MTLETILNEYLAPSIVAVGTGVAAIVNYNRPLAAFILLLTAGYVVCGNKTKNYLKQASYPKSDK